MKLTSRILLRILLPLLLLFTVWTLLFYAAIIDEVDDEVDDSLELYAENLIRRHLDGRVLPEADNGTNNTFFIEKIAAASGHELHYSDETVWIDAAGEYEPARVLRTTFTGSDGGSYLLTVMTPTIEKEDLVGSMLFWVVVLYVALLAIIAVVVTLVLRRSMQPLYKLLGWLDGYRAGEAVKPLDNPTRVDEFARLNEAALNFGRRNQEMFEQQKEFIGNASHEIQTPLAICANRLEMLAETPLTEQQLGEVLKTQQTIDYISRLNRSLLLLTKIDSGQFHEVETVDIGELVAARIADLGEIYSQRGIAVDVVADGTFTAEMNRSLAVVMVTNLLKNAFVHNAEGGRIRIEITADSLTVRNSGQPSPLDSARVFTRFYQAEKREGSTGLGLALVASAARLYGFEVSYRFEEGLHCFAVARRRSTSAKTARAFAAESSAK